MSIHYTFIKRVASFTLASAMLLGFLDTHAKTYAVASVSAESTVNISTSSDTAESLATIYTPLSEQITIQPGQLDSDSNGTIWDSDIYGCVVHYNLKKGHTLSISDENYIFSVRRLMDNNYSTMLKQATTASFTATEDMTVGMLIRKPDKSTLTAEELSGVTIIDSRYNMIGVDGYEHAFTVEAETIDGGTATTRAAIFLPDSYSESGDPTRLIIMTNGLHGHLTDSVWNANTDDDVGVMKHYLDNDYAVIIVNNTANQTGSTPDLGNPQLVSSYWKAYEYVQANFNVEELFSIHSRSQGTFAAVRLMREHPELVKCAVMCGAVLSLKSRFSQAPAFIAGRYGFDDLSGATWEADKVVGYDPYTDVNGLEYDLPPTFWMLAESDATTAHLSTIEKIKNHGNDVSQALYTQTDHSGVCRLNIEACRTDSLAFLEKHQETTPEHRFCAWNTTTEATCTGAGEMRRYCADCEHYDSMDIPALSGHVFESNETVCDICGTRFDVTHTEITLTPGQFDNATGNWVASDIYGCVIGYELKAGHTLSISNTDYVFAVRILENGSYATMVKEATSDNFVAEEDMTIAVRVRKPDKSALTEDELVSIVLYDSYYVEHSHGYETTVTAPTCTEQGYTTYTCECGDSYVSDYVDANCHTYENGLCIVCGVADWDTDGDGVLEILAIGNSFSVDALQYAWQIANDLGIEEIVIGNLYIGGCTLETHAANAAGDLAQYKYYYNDSGRWTITKSYQISTALESRSWDYVSMQQASAYSGVESSYNEDLTNLIAYVQARSDAKLVWHMTWAYHQDVKPPTYNRDQMTMYNAIVSAVESKIVTNDAFYAIIPNGTAVQNSRTSLLGDTTTRDGYHLSTDYGRYLAGLMLIKTITGLSIDNITYRPDGVDATEQQIAIESVNNAAANPFAVTESAYTGEAPEEGYLLLETELYQGAFWQPMEADRYNTLIADASNSQCFFTTVRFTRDMLPVGSIIILADGYQYRPDGWVTDELQTGTREAVTTQPYVVVTEEWWGDYTIRSFNVSLVSGGSVMSLTEEEMRAAFRIYVPHTHTYSNGLCTVCGGSVLNGGYTAAVPENQGVQNAIDRAHALTDVEWTPVADVPGVQKIDGMYTVITFEAGTTYRGIPYSGVTANDCYVGLNVSLESFLTALENGNSVLYTENLNSTNKKAATYYGTVCSKFVQYALNVPGSYNTNNVANIPGMQTIALPGEYTVDQIKLSDVVLNTSTHTTICTGILYDADGNVAFIEVSEAVSPLCRRLYWSPEEFYEHFANYRLCRYAYIDEVPAADESELKTSYALMPRYGDKNNYKVSSTKGVVDILESGYSTAVILRDGCVIDEITLNGATTFTFDRSVPGNLEMYLEKEDGTRSGSVYARVVKSSVVVEDATQFVNGKLTVSIDGSSGTPLYVQVGSAHAIFCNVEGQDGTVELTFPVSKISTKQVRVAYENEYGIYLSSWVSFTAEENPSTDPLLSQGKYWNGYNIAPSSPTPVIQSNKVGYWSYTMIPVEENTTYYSEGATRMWYLDADGNPISTYNAYKDGDVPFQFTTPVNTAYVNIAYSPNLIEQGSESIAEVLETEPLVLRYDDHYDLTGKTVEIVDAGTPTSYKVGYGVEQNAVLDTAVVTLEGEVLVATGIGTATVKIDNVTYEVTVEAAPISLLLLIGQSNMQGSEGNANQSIVCPDGMVYSTYGDRYTMTVDNASNFAPSALTGVGSAVNVNGTTTNLEDWPVYLLNEAGAGKAGPDSGFAYEWIQQTGEKVWVVNAAHGGTKIEAWLDGGTQYEECVLLFKACLETLRKEIDAGHFTLSHMGYFWCQGCSNYSVTAEWYVEKYLAMHENLKTELAFDEETTFEFGGIIPVRAGHEYYTSYRQGTYTDTTTAAYHESFKDLRFTGSRVAHYWLINNPELTDIWGVCNIGEDWVWMPDGTNGVEEYFNKHYENGTVDYATQVQQSASWYKPTTPAAVHDSIHYNQIGYNEVGRESVRNALILLGEIEVPEVETTVDLLTWDGYTEATEVHASTKGNSGTLVVPLVSPIWTSKDVTYALSDGLTWSYYDLLAEDAQTTGTLTMAGETVSIVESEPGAYFAEHLSELPEYMCQGVNLWAVLEHEQGYYKPSEAGYGQHSSGQIYSITIPVNAGDKIWATSFQNNANSGNAVSSSDGIRVTYFGEYEVVQSMAGSEVYAEFTANGYITVPEGTIAVNIPMWNNSDDNEIYLLNYAHDTTAEICSICGSSSHTHSWSDWETVAEPSAEGSGTKRRICACGEVEEEEINGVWQTTNILEYLQQLPDNLCSGTNLWTILDHDDTYYIVSRADWGYHSSREVPSITIPLNGGDKLYATSFGPADTNGHGSSNGIRVTFFDAYGVAKSTGPADTYKEFVANGGYLVAPEGTVAVNIPMWGDDDSHEVYILSAEHDYAGTTCTLCNAEHPEAADYAGKVISILGDSISTFAGYTPIADGFNLTHRNRYPQDNLLTDVNETWWMQVITELDAKLGINDSWAGSRVSNTITGNSGDQGEDSCMASLTRIQNLGANGTPDVILFYGGTNDIGHLITLGTFDPETAPVEVDLTATKWNTVADAYVAAILRLKYYYPEAQLVAMHPTYTTSYYTTSELAEYNAMFTAICEHYGVIYTDLRECGITTADLPDGIHPDATGMDYITEAALNVLLNECDVEVGEHTVYAVSHQMEGVTASLSYYKGISAGRTFTETLTGENMTVTVTMDGVDITSTCYTNDTIHIPEVTGDLVIIATGYVKPAHADYLQQLPDNVCAGVNLWPLLIHDAEYYTVNGWGVHSSGSVYSVTIPITAGDQIWATSFQAAGLNGTNANGIRLTWFGEETVLKSLSPNETFAEFASNGYLTAPEGSVAVNVVMWTGDDSNELYLLSAEHTYETTVTPPSCTEQGYTIYTCACGNSYVADYVDAAHRFSPWIEDPNEGTYRNCLNCDYTETSNVTVAKVGESEYFTLSDAIQAAAAINGTVTLQTDLQITGAFLPSGVTLDLGEFALTADYLIGLKGSYLTATPNAGKLMIDKDGLFLSGEGYKNASGQSILPIWDPNQNCYLFSLFVLNTDSQQKRGLTIDEENEQIYFQFKHQATRAINQTLLKDGSSDNALEIIVRLVWTTDNGEAYQDFVYNDAFVGKVSGSYDYTFTLNGYSAMNINLDTLSVTAMILADSGATASSVVWTAESAN